MGNEMDKEKWINDTARLFFQIFSVDYEEIFIRKLLSGGGGNSTLCATWMHLNNYFVGYRISKKAYELLLKKVQPEDKNKIKFDNNTVYVSRKIYKKYSKMFYNNAKGSENRTEAGKVFHFDHNPSNKKVLELLNSKIKRQKNEEGLLQELVEYIKKIQTVDLITVEEDDIRTQADRKNENGPLLGEERDELLKTEFYVLEEMK